MSEAKPPERDENGRWLPGYTPNPSGRPKGTGGKLLMDAFDRALTPEKADAIAIRCVELAIKGDRFAREDLAKLYALFQDRLHLSGAAQILWNWQPPGEREEQAEEKTEDGDA